MATYLKSHKNKTFSGACGRVVGSAWWCSEHCVKPGVRGGRGRRGMWCALGSLISLARPSCCPPFSSGDWNGLYHDGSAVSTPSFAALARNGTAFRKAYVPTPLCAPSRSSMALKVECHLKLEAAHGGAKPKKKKKKADTGTSLRLCSPTRCEGDQARCRRCYGSPRRTSRRLCRCGAACMGTGLITRLVGLKGSPPS